MSTPHFVFVVYSDRVKRLTKQRDELLTFTDMNSTLISKRVSLDHCSKGRVTKTKRGLQPTQDDTNESVASRTSFYNGIVDNGLFCYLVFTDYINNMICIKTGTIQ